MLTSLPRKPWLPTHTPPRQASACPPSSGGELGQSFPFVLEKRSRAYAAKTVVLLALAHRQ